jgi:hypothetical protein
VVRRIECVILKANPKVKTHKKMKFKENNKLSKEVT